MLAPVLARLEGLRGVEEAKTDVTGRHFAVRLSATAGVDAVSRDVLVLLGPHASRLDGAREAHELGRLDGCELWMRARETRTLSRIEARVLAARIGGAAARAADLAPGDAGRVIDALHDELALEFERVHGRGGALEKTWYVAAFPAAMTRAFERIGEWLTADQMAAVREGVARQMPR